MTCTNPHCEDGWVERRDDEPGGPPTIRCWVCAAKAATADEAVGMILHLILRADETGAQVIFATLDEDKRDRVLLELVLSGANRGGAHHYPDLIQLADRTIVDGLICAEQDADALAAEFST